MNHPSFLIVGAGATGLVNGYYLHLGGSSVTYLVRPGKKVASAPPAVLYSYDDGELKTFDGFNVEDDVAALADRTFDYVIVTLDYAACFSEQGTKLLASLGRTFADTSTVLVHTGIGMGLREHVVGASDLPLERVLSGLASISSHQTTASLPVTPPTDAATLAKARVAYRHLSGMSLVVGDASPEAAHNLAEIYNRSGRSGSAVVPQSQLEVQTNAIFPCLAAAEIAGWPSMKDLTAIGDLWSLSCEAQREVASLREFGMPADVIAETMSDDALAQSQIRTEQACLPLDYQAFNRFHHGVKVSAQDLQVMRKCRDAGQRQGLRMSALNQIIVQLEESRASS